MKNSFKIFLLFFLFYACATPVAPTGGEADNEPPKVKVTQPINGLTNFSVDKIEFIFDEFIVYSSSTDKLLITPPMPSKPKINVKGKKLIIQLPDSLVDNTTYNISFLGAISDYSVGNSIDILNYVFSTGDYIDSASISGFVKDAKSNTTLENITVGLYGIEDTGILIYSTPKYLGKTDKNGQFKINYIKDGEYILAALEDKNLNFIFDQSSERISIPSNPIFINNKTVLEQEIYLFSNSSKTLVNDYKLLNNNKLYFYFNNEIEQLSLDVNPYFKDDFYELNYTNDTLFYYWSNDTLSATTFYFDLNNESKDTIVVNYAKNKVLQNIRLPQTNVPKNEAIVINFPLLITAVNNDLIHLKDSFNNSIPFTTNFNKNNLKISASLKENENYKITIDSSAVNYFTATHNKKAFNAKVKIIDEKFKSKLILTFNDTKKENFVLELLNEKQVKIKQYNIDNLEELEISNLNEGIYYIRIYHDFNSNGKWNTGNLEANLEAEKTLFYSPKIEIKANWDKELSINL